MHLRQCHLLHNLHLCGKGDLLREHLRDVERNDQDASKPVARHFNLPNYFKQHVRQFAAFLNIQEVRKAAKHLNKNLSSKSALLISTVSTSAFHFTNLFLFSRHHIPTNSVAPFSAYKPTHNPQFLQSLCRRANARNVSLYTLNGG